MCGIVGYVGRREAAPILLDGLKRLEYRGYDSAGICTLDGTGLQLRKCVGRVDSLITVVRAQPLQGTLGISHTRWATHGLPSDTNAHPHLDQSGRLVIVHNGIIENYADLRRQLVEAGHHFQSQTDTEVLAHLIGRHLDERVPRGQRPTPEQLVHAVQEATGHAEGTYAIAVLHADLPVCLVGARRGSPLVLGLGKGENFLASDVSPILPHTRRVVYLQDGDIALLYADRYQLWAGGRPVERPVDTVQWSAEEAELGGYPHYMLKEIHEQPGRIADELKRVLRSEQGWAEFDALTPHLEELIRIKRLVLVACGTSWHAALVGEYLLENLAGVPTEVECASEMRYRNRPFEEGTLVLAISQSGETADTLAATRLAHEQKVRTLALVNVIGSTLARECDWTLYMRAGPEIGVASTKAFTMQLLQLTLLALTLGRKRGRISLAEGRRMARALQAIPDKMQRILRDEPRIIRVAKKYYRFTDFLYMGRQYNFPIALEGALKLKEISYIHAEGYPSAEMKHGPIALISPEFPSVFVIPKDALYEKNLSNLEEIKARSGPIIAVATAGDCEIRKKVDDVLYIPPTLDCLQPLLAVVPLQLFAYHVALLRGCDVDKPRNLAKSVTVE
ncbi:MAG: glutamine--fructose-6-phosphate transaminase (isomerizing) [Verrucomicrobiota bacterium]|nr:glutamine--fructose-6-phosphate transaminase (isomerizing) [Limisphaera sp.]MDW8381310.1 glutamine--fructose-6-phosphate transaminase (isomerizing) [Verrucomicrobiota bacterium]